MRGPCWNNPILVGDWSGMECCIEWVGNIWLCRISVWYACAYDRGMPRLRAALSASASRILFSLALLFWNHIFTCVSVSFKNSANSALSATDKYLCCRNFLSRAINWVLVNGVRGLRSFFCFFSLAGRGDVIVFETTKKGKENRSHWSTSIIRIVVMPQCHQVGSIYLLVMLYARKHISYILK